jgi:ubiquinone/menaquinone biosynthesis C-methylase UbiE
MVHHQSRAHYGNWIRRRIIGRIGILAVLLLLVSFLPLPLPGRLLLWLCSGTSFFVVIYLMSVYLLFSDSGGNLQTKVRQVVLDHLSWDGSGKALDIGTGNGALAIRLAKSYPQSFTEGVDVWGHQWEYAHSICERNALIEHVEDRVHFQHGSAAHLPFPDESFDAVVSHFVFHEVAASDKRQVLHEALRVVRQGGPFAFQDMFLDQSLYGEISDLVGMLHHWGMREVHFIPTKDVMAIPFLVRNRRALGYAGLLYGRK